MPASALGRAYDDRRAWITEYFDRTAPAAWARLTSDAPVSGIRRTVRAGRDRMRATLAAWLPADLRGARVLDAGCGPGGFAIELGERGARVVAADVSPTLVSLARERAVSSCGARHIGWRVGDLLDPSFGRFDYVVAMDSLIHYPAPQMLDALDALAARTRVAVAATFAPATPLLSTMHLAGRLFPRGDRAPAIEPVAEARLRARLAAAPALGGWRVGRTERVASGFYTSQAIELTRAAGDRAAPPPAPPSGSRTTITPEDLR
ncbi:magnesium protoporphyrin IX methyltransferase [Roseisolibacter sp. H3M3-2]|uniref:magnesium protoporphyrin IX methyltransferase n=1 Tax=Roseisolibacter sp. H3M3-2 TaxID=3031323 RepID=UPI0023DA6795|nr:magnesium protoporphyrin IX methyltransferase [Roseisolibacter sp. H3M3-2]MDF1501855.1 magnesium protoporphyrin IX methyltransferase [Roseisolibacter sp. H3M3-2]